MEEKKRQDLKVRTRQFALQIVNLYTALPKTTEAQILGKQLLRSGTSVGAHYCEADELIAIFVTMVKRVKAKQ